LKSFFSFQCYGLFFRYHYLYSSDIREKKWIFVSECQTKIKERLNGSIIFLHLAITSKFAESDTYSEHDVRDENVNWLKVSWERWGENKRHSCAWEMYTYTHTYTYYIVCGIIWSLLLSIHPPEEVYCNSILSSRSSHRSPSVFQPFCLSYDTPLSDCSHRPEIYALATRLNTQLYHPSLH